MKIPFVISALAAGLITAGFATAGTPAATGERVTLGTCISAALERYPGEVIERKLEVENGNPVFEIEIRGAHGRVLEIECNALTGEVLQAEYDEVEVAAPDFMRGAKLSELQARHIALNAVPGSIVGTEYEVTPSGRYVYEFALRSESGREIEVEVDALTGAVLEVSEEVMAFDQG